MLLFHLYYLLCLNLPSTKYNSLCDHAPMLKGLDVGWGVLLESYCTIIVKISPNNLVIKVFFDSLANMNLC